MYQTERQITVTFDKQETEKQVWMVLFQSLFLYFVFTCRQIYAYYKLYYDWLKHTHTHTHQDLLQSLNSLEANRIKVDVNRCERGDDFSLQLWHFGNSQQPKPSGQLTEVQICAAANRHNGHNAGISKDTACRDGTINNNRTIYRVLSANQSALQPN